MDKIDEQIKYWTESANRSMATASSLYKTHHYDFCLFCCHLALEKLLKGLVVAKLKESAPYTHNLAELSTKANLDLSNEQVQDLRIITTFNIAGRYDDVKFAFYKKCTKEYTRKYYNISKGLYLWLKKQYLKK